jgi:nucleoside-diphosphate-sugar epimerase
MFMDDAIKATIDLMDAPTEKVKIRSSYNLGGISFKPKELAEEIRKELPNFNINYEPDFRQAIADSWPNSIDETHAQKDWNWKHTFDLKAIVKTMLDKVKIS